jgi:hypothetical protein
MVNANQTVCLYFQHTNIKYFLLREFVPPRNPAPRLVARFEAAIQLATHRLR